MRVFENLSMDIALFLFETYKHWLVIVYWDQNLID